MGVTDITIFLNSISLEEFIKLIKEYNNLIDERLEIRKLYKGKTYKTVNKITKEEFYGEEADDTYDIFVYRNFI